MDINDEMAAKRIMRILNANGYVVTKSDVLWIIDRMTEELERQVDDSNSVSRKEG